METSSTTANQTRNRTFMRIAMVLLGIVTAVIGMLSDVQLMKKEGGASGMMGTTKIAVADFSVQLTSKVASTLWLFNND